MTEMIATRTAYGEALAELGRENKNIVVLDADLSKSTKSATFGSEFPDRHFNCGIAEQNMMGIAAGLATTGKIPFASTFAMFGAGRAFEVIRNSICYPKLNVKIALTHSGLTVGEDGATHQSVEDIAIMRAIPNMVVLCPADATETKKMVRKAAEYKGPVYLRLGRPNLPVLFDDSYDFEIGKATELKQGDDVTIIATGIMTSTALEASEKLAEEGIKARVINMGTIKPIDEEAIVKAAKETKAIVTAEEHSVIGGLGSAVADVVG
ncbi:MAG TPA: transketolase, partial [Eubacteriaceae bacterium]|nr:transketolase [Eubacteriaceae bacterium]